MARKRKSRENDTAEARRERIEKAHERRMKKRKYKKNAEKKHVDHDHADLEKYHQRREAQNRTSKNVGVIIASIQAVLSLVFMASLLVLGMLPAKYLVVIFVILAVFGALSFVGQLKSKKNALTGKILSAIFSIVLLITSLLIFRASGVVGEISGGNTKVDKMVVAVLADDSAKDIEDAEDYNFGIQYQLKAEQMQSAIENINSEVGGEIQTTECTSVQHQAEMLLNGEVDAIIYNDAYDSIIETQFEDFNDKVKIIYSYEIETEVEGLVMDVEVQNSPFTVYISGIDVYGDIEKNSRSDVNILAEVNPVTHQILLVTTPRDYYVELPGISYGMGDKLTHAGIYGVDVSMDTLSQLYNVETEFYVRLNFTSMIEIVDALGGIDVYSEYAFTTSKNSGKVMDVVEGMNHFNGKEALAFSRERKNVPGGDDQRGKNQQAVITAMLQKAISPTILLSASDILSSVSGNIDTNMTEKQIQSLIKSQLANPHAWKIKSMAAEGIPAMLPCYSTGYISLSVAQPIQESVDSITAAMQAVENGEVFDDSTVVK